MNSLLDSDPYHDSHTGADREISLGTATILGIFFALALVCAGFFGFGYTLGRKSAQTPAVPDPLSAPASAPSSQSVVVKPSAGSAATSSSSADLSASTAPTEPIASKAGPAPAIAVDKSPTPAVSTLPTSPQPAASGQQPAISPGGAFMVQIAAVSTQEIADIEVTALKKYGFDVFVRHEPQDQLLHVQIGPYATRKDAVAMQQIILARGFNAIVK